MRMEIDTTKLRWAKLLTNEGAAKYKDDIDTFIEEVNQLVFAYSDDGSDFRGDEEELTEDEYSEYFENEYGCKNIDELINAVNHRAYELFETECPIHFRWTWNGIDSIWFNKSQDFIDYGLSISYMEDNYELKDNISIQS